MKRVLLFSLTLLLATATLAQAQRMPVTTSSDAARTHFTQGVEAISHADFARARPHFEAAVAADPDFALAHLYQAVLAPDGERDAPMRLAAAGSASDAERQMIESYAANLEGDHDREAALLTALAERFPSDPMPMFWWANTEANRGRPAEAVAAAEQALTADPSFAPAYNLIGYAEMAAGNADAAGAAFQSYIRLAPDEANPYDSYGEFLMNQGRLDEAEAQFEMALAKDPTFSVSQTNLVRIGIMRTNSAFEAAVAAGDADALASLYTQDAVAYPPGAAPVRGRDAIRDLFAGYFESGVDGVTLDTHEVRALGNYAHEIGIGTIAVGGEAGDPFNFSVLWLNDDGTWRLHRDIWN